MAFVTFSRLSSQKKGNLFFFISVLQFFSVFTGFFYGFCGKQQIVLNWPDLSEGVPAQLCGFLAGGGFLGGLGRGLSTGLRLFVWGFLIKGLFMIKCLMYIFRLL